MYAVYRWIEDGSRALSHLAERSRVVIDWYCHVASSVPVMSRHSIDPVGCRHPQEARSRSPLRRFLEGRRSGTSARPAARRSEEPEEPRSMGHAGSGDPGLACMSVGNAMVIGVFVQRLSRGQALSTTAVFARRGPSSSTTLVRHRANPGPDSPCDTVIRARIPVEQAST